MKQVYIVVALVVIILGGFIIFQFAQPEANQELVEYSDAEANTFIVQYDSSGETVVLDLSGEQYELSRSETDTGIKYKNEDGSVVFSESEGEAQVELDGEIIFEGATPSEQRRVEVLKSNKQGDPDANKYDFANDPCDNMDQDCTGGDDVSAVDITCGPGTVLEDDTCVPEALDDDDDGDSIPTEDDASVVNEENPLAVDGMEWVVSAASYSNGTAMTITEGGEFAATFAADGTFSSETDCNSIYGQYTLEGNTISFGPLASTRMYCEDSQESMYSEMLSEVSSYMITEEGNLVLMLKFDSGSIVFVPVMSESAKATDYNSSRSNKNSNG